MSGGGVPERLQDPVRIIHKDQDVISTFCINAVTFCFFYFFFSCLTEIRIYDCFKRLIDIIRIILYCNDEMFNFEMP